MSEFDIVAKSLLNYLLAIALIFQSLYKFSQTAFYGNEEGLVYTSICLSSALRFISASTYQYFFTLWY